MWQNLYMLFFRLFEEIYVGCLAKAEWVFIISKTFITGLIPSLKLFIVHFFNISFKHYFRFAYLSITVLVLRKPTNLCFKKSIWDWTSKIRRIRSFFYIAPLTFVSVSISWAMSADLCRFDLSGLYPFKFFSRAFRPDASCFMRLSILLQFP